MSPQNRPNGQLFIVSAPSGAGKTSLVNALLEKDPGLRLSISYTTRAPRPGEQDGVHYHFIKHRDFENMLTDKAFVEHAKVFDHYYGTAQAWLVEQLAQGTDVILEIDWQGAELVRTMTEASSIFIMPPSREALENRLQNRKQDSPDVIAKRMAKAISEMTHYGEFDYVVINDLFETALGELQCIVAAERLRTDRQIGRHHGLIQSLLAS